MSLYEHVLTKTPESTLSVNKVLKNTYMLLGLTLMFSAVTAWWAMTTHARPLSPMLVMIGYFGLLFATNALKNSAWGLASILAFTGFIGYTLGPILNFYINTFSNGNQIVMTALGGTGVIFISLSLYALVTKKDFSYLTGFLFVGITIAFLGSILSIFVQTPLLDFLVSAAFILFSSGIILFQTSQIIHGGERNYIMATITLYVALLNLFLSLLRILSMFGGRR